MASTSALSVGPPPAPVLALLEITRIKLLVAAAGSTAVAVLLFILDKIFDFGLNLLL